MTQFSSVQSLSHIQLLGTPWTAVASLSITNSRSLLKLKKHPLLLLLSVFPSIMVFSNESVLLSSVQFLSRVRLFATP